jgi:hypothetical protein
MLAIASEGSGSVLQPVGLTLTNRDAEAVLHDSLVCLTNTQATYVVLA